MVERVRDDRILRAEQRLEQARICIEAGGIEDRVLHPQEGGDPALQLLVHRLRAADEAHGRHAVAIALQRVLSRRDKLGMVRQPEVVVGAEVDHLVTGGQRHGARLRRGDDALGLEQARLADRVALG